MYISVVSASSAKTLDSSYRRRCIHQASLNFLLYHFVYLSLLDYFVLNFLLSSRSLLTQFCYKVLEQSRDPSQKHVRETIFEVKH